jgi:hypothetical protein
MKTKSTWLAMHLERITKTSPFNHSSRTNLLVLPMAAGLKQFAIYGFLLFGLLLTVAAGADSQRWVLSVKPGFSPSDVVVLGGTFRWYWPEAGIAAVDSANPNFGVVAEGGNIEFAVADVAAIPPSPLAVPKILAAQKKKATSKTKASRSTLDAYAANYQWCWQAIGATKPRPAIEPEWQLGTYTGSGIKIGIIDCGAPARWDPPLFDWPNLGNPVALHPEFNEYNPAHPELGGVVLLRDPITGEVLNLDDDSHGTAVASLIGAQHRSAGAMRGLAPKATLYCHRVDWDNWLSSELEGWYKAAEFGCQILNNSWLDVELPVMRYEDVQVKLPKIFRQAATELHRRGILIVAAAGNWPIDQGKDIDTFYLIGSDNQSGFSALKFIPQDMPNVIVAGGTGPSDYDPFASDLTKYDPWPGSPAGAQKGREFNLDRVVNMCWPPVYGGPAWEGSTYGTFLTVVAPMGENIKDWNVPIENLAYQLLYVAAPYDYWPNGEGLHDYLAGTSFSSPITCGVAALAAEAYFRAHGVMPSPVTLATILKASADDLVGPPTDDLWVWNEKTLQFDFVTNVPTDQPGKDIRYGYGRVNARKAIEQALK